MTSYTPLAGAIRHIVEEKYIHNDVIKIYLLKRQLSEAGFTTASNLEIFLVLAGLVEEDALEVLEINHAESHWSSGFSFRKK